MRTSLKWLGLAMLLAATPVAAASGLRGIMHGWRAGARITNGMLSGRARFSEAKVRAALQAYVDEAGQVAARIHGQSAAARDFKARFAGFQADAKAALGDVARPAALKTDFSRITSDCQSCHNVYNN